MPSIKRDFTMEQGADFQLVHYMTDDNGIAFPANTTGYTSASQFRPFYYFTNSYSFNTTLQVGQLIMSMNAAQTANVTPGRYVYDVIITDPSNVVYRILEGTLFVEASVTR